MASRSQVWRTRLDEFSREFDRLSSELDASLDMQRDQSRKWAHNEVAFKKAWAIAYTESTGTVRACESIADEKTARERYEYLLAERMARVARDATESRRTQISALQSLLAAERAEADFERTGPN